jgi:hypothetical protein
MRGDVLRMQHEERVGTWLRCNFDYHFAWRLEMAAEGGVRAAPPTCTPPCAVCRRPPPTRPHETRWECILVWWRVVLGPVALLQGAGGAVAQGGVLGVGDLWKVVGWPEKNEPLVPFPQPPPLRGFRLAAPRALLDLSP